VEVDPAPAGGAVVVVVDEPGWGTVGLVGVGLAWVVEVVEPGSVVVVDDGAVVVVLVGIVTWARAVRAPAVRRAANATAATAKG
jgi:hypothetical protein